MKWISIEWTPSYVDHPINGISSVEGTGGKCGTPNATLNNINRIHQNFDTHSCELMLILIRLLIGITAKSRVFGECTIFIWCEIVELFVTTIARWNVLFEMRDWWWVTNSKRIFIFLIEIFLMNLFRLYTYLLSCKCTYHNIICFVSKFLCILFIRNQTHYSPWSTLNKKINKFALKTIFAHILHSSMILSMNIPIFRFFRPRLYSILIIFQFFFLLIRFGFWNVYCI